MEDFNVIEGEDDLQRPPKESFYALYANKRLSMIEGGGDDSFKLGEDDLLQALQNEKESEEETKPFEEIAARYQYCQGTWRKSSKRITEKAF